MTSVEIIQISRRKEKKQFLRLPWDLHQQNPYWTPPLRTSQAELIGYKRHPFHDQADVQTFLARQGNEVVGRIAGIDNRAHRAAHLDETLGFVGFFDSIDDQEVADGLLGAVADWFADRDIRWLRGPANPSMNYECGLLIEGFDCHATFMMPYNPDYYPTLWEQFGFSKSHDLLALEVDIGMMDDTKDFREKLQYMYREVERRHTLNVRMVDTQNFQRDVRSFLDIYNLASQQTWGFVPFSESEILQLSGELRHLIVPELTAVVELDGRNVGSMFAMLDYNPLIKEIDGRLFPFGFLKLLRRRKNIRRIRIMSANVVPEYQRWGISLMLVGELFQRGMAWGLEEAEMSYILESNRPARKHLEQMGARRAKTYRMYDYRGD